MRQPLGPKGEQWAAEYLTARGVTILARNWHSRYGEIDLIGATERFILFVEVKCRKTGGMEAPLEAVSPAKQQRLRLTAETWLMEHPEETRQPRMDVCAILAPQGVRTEHPQICYIENAF